MPTKKEKHDNATHDFLNIRWRLDSEVSSALLKVVEQTTPSHTLKSRKYSLLKLIRVHADLAITNWLARNNEQVPWKFSELVKTPYGYALTILQRLAGQGRLTDDFGGNDFSRTCDSLIEFLHFCGEHNSIHIKVVQLEPSDGHTFDAVNERIGRGISLGARSTSSAAPVPDYLIAEYRRLKSENLCLACGQLTSANTERNRLLEVPLDEKVEKRLAKGSQFSTKNRGSLLYCHAHAEGTESSSAAKKGRKLRTKFMSLLLAMKRKGVASQLNALFPPNFNLELARLAIKSDACQEALEMIELQLPLHINGSTEQSKAVSEIIFNGIKSMHLDILKLKADPFDAPAAIKRLTVGQRDGVTILNPLANFDFK